jgi:hypothetical protein
MKHNAFALLLAVSGAVVGCDEQQYVSPDTVALIVTDDATNTQRVNRCLYIPVLLGGRVVFRYEVDAEVKALLVITRDEVTVSFEPEEAAEPFSVDTDDLTETQRHEAESPPSGYTVELSAGCTPDDDDFR